MEILAKPGCYGFVRKENGEVVYVGESNNIERRYNFHKYMWINNLEGKVLYKAFQKYGFENFKFVIFEYCETKEEALDLEKKYHEIHQPKYSIRAPGTNGGGSPEVRPFTVLNIETGELRSYRTRPDAQRDLGFKVHRILEQSRNREREWVGKYDDDNTPWQELYVRATTRPDRQKEIQQFDKQGNFIAEFNSITEASTTLNIGRTNIAANLRGRTKSAGGFVWKYKEGEI